MSAAAKTRVVAMTLALCGVVAMAVGASALLAPVSFFSSNGIMLGDSVSLRSEVRAAGGMNLAVGVAIFTGAWIARWRPSSARASAMFYLAYGVSRLVGFALDGTPSEHLVTAAMVELALGAACVIALMVLPDRVSTDHP